MQFDASILKNAKPRKNRYEMKWMRVFDEKAAAAVELRCH